MVVVQGAFHGRTYGALSATPQESKQAPFAPLVPGFIVVPKDPAALADAVDDDTAAVLLEPIQGETGIHVLSDALLEAAREACDRSGAASCSTRSRPGWDARARSGRYEQTAVVPDAMTSAKALGGGLPIGALITGPRLADTFQPGDHGSTFAGGPLIASAALVALEICSDPALLARVRVAGRAAGGGAGGAAVRGGGPRPRSDAGHRRRSGVSTPPSSRGGRCSSSALVVNATGPATIRLEPPLIVSEEEIDEAVARLGALVP